MSSLRRKRGYTNVCSGCFVREMFSNSQTEILSAVAVRMSKADEWPYRPVKLNYLRRGGK